MEAGVDTEATTDMARVVVAALAAPRAAAEARMVGLMALEAAILAKVTAVGKVKVVGEELAAMLGLVAMLAVRLVVASGGCSAVLKRAAARRCARLHGQSCRPEIV